MLYAFYGLAGAFLTVLTATSLGLPVVRWLRPALYDMERQLFGFIFGSVLLNAIVFGLSSGHQARKSVFLVLGLLSFALAMAAGAFRRGEKLPPVPRVWAWIFIAVFGAITAVYVVNALTPQLGPDNVTARLSLADRAHGFQPGARLFEFFALFAFAIGRHSAVALFDTALLAAACLLVLFYGRRAGYPRTGGVLAILGLLAPLVHVNVAAAAMLFVSFYLLQPAIWRALPSWGNGVTRTYETVRRVPWPVWVVLPVAGLLLFSYIDRSDTLHFYFWIEQKMVDREPTESRRHTIEAIAPRLCRMGILHPARIQTHPGVSFLLDPRDLVAVTILRGGDWQPEVWDSLTPALPSGAVFLDVGAHIGYFSMRAAVRVGPSGRVVSFEPNPETLKLLRDNVTANRAQNVTVEPIACTDREQMLTLYAAPSMNTGASSLSRQNADLTADEPPRPYPVRGRPIDDVVRELNLSRVDAIKIDVEGAEVYVLRGAAGTLRRFHPRVVIEEVERQLNEMQTSVEELVSILKSAGYTHSRQIDDTDWEWTAPMS